ncbi:hypothetical protein CUMW_118530 [Citrus unshiu]|nr:hypothetical protein CUMW_118530 [Citrus unshiu]
MMMSNNKPLKKSGTFQFQRSQSMELQNLPPPQLLAPKPQRSATLQRVRPQARDSLVSNVIFSCMSFVLFLPQTLKNHPLTLPARSSFSFPNPVQRRNNEIKV